MARKAPPAPVPPSRWRALCLLVVGMAVAVTGLAAFVTMSELPERLGFYSGLPRGLKASDDHGVVVFAAQRLAEMAGERDAVAVTTANQSGVLRYYLMPRPVYVLPEVTARVLDPAYIAQHRKFLEERGIRWLIWVPWDEASGADSWRRARLYDAEAALRGHPGPGARVWCYAADERPTHLTDWLAAAAVLALIGVLGWAAFRLLIRGEAMSWLEALPRYFALGLIALYAGISWPMLLGARLGRWAVVGIGLGLVAAATAARLLTPRVAAQAPAPTRAAPPARRSLVRLAAIAACVAVFLSVAAIAVVMPVRNVDAVHHWGYAAKIFHHEGGVWNPLYFDVERGYVYGRYPILVPVTLFTMFEAMGRVEDQAVKLLFPALFGMLLLGLYGAMRRERPGLGALLVLACLAWCGAYTRYEGGAVSALADVPLSFFLLLGLVEWRRWAASGKRGHLLAWVLLLCGAAVTKMEGLAALAFALLAAGWLRRKLRPVPWRRVALALACVGVLVAPWYGFARLLPSVRGFTPESGSAFSALPRNLATLGSSAREFFEEAGNFTKDPEGHYLNNWGGFWLLVLVAVALGWRAAPAGGRALVGLFALQVAVYFGAYLLVPVDPKGLVTATKMRLLLQLAPTAAYLAWCFLPPLPRWLDGPRREKA